MDKIRIVIATPADAPVINRLANDIWWPTYQHYIPHGQIKLMLEKLYAAEALQEQMDAGQRFIIASLDNDPLGFASYRLKPEDDAIVRIEKLYVLSTAQGKGVGKLLINHIANAARHLNIRCLELNVNRNNAPARSFYEKMGFAIVAETDTPYHGYVLDDYVMQKTL